MYWGSMMVLGAGALLIIHNIARLDFTLLIDIATGLAVLTAPFMAFINHRAILGSEVPEAHRPGRAMRRFSALCVALLSVFAMWWLYVRFLA